MRFVLRAWMIVCVTAACGAMRAQEVKQWAQMTSPKIAALDRAKTVIVITDAILEEHGPYLPTGVDGAWDERVGGSLARHLATTREDWSIVTLPMVPLGANAANVVAKRWSFPGSLTVREETMRAVMMDVADALGEQGFKWVFIVDSHGGPTNSVALDAASDYFHDTYGGTMVHLLGLMPMVTCCDAITQFLTPEQLKTNGMSIHADALEQSQGLYAYAGDGLVPNSYKTAPVLAGADFAGLMAQAAKPEWPGYLGAPALGSYAIGMKYFAQTVVALHAMADSILDGKVDPAKMPRYGATMFAETTAVERPLRVHEAAAKARQEKWLKEHAAVQPK